MSGPKKDAKPKASEQEVTLLFPARMGGKELPGGTKVKVDQATLAELTAAKCVVVETESALEDEADDKPE